MSASLVVFVGLAALIAVQAVASYYLLILTVAAPLSRRKAPPRADEPRTRFAIVIPAHNEELLLPALLQSLAQQVYPPDLYTVHVIADNCLDGTAEVGRAAGVSVHERFDETLRGKGQAISWLLAKFADAQAEPVVLDDPSAMPAPAADAFLFVDADSRLSPNFLDTMDRYLSEGKHTALQASYRVRDPESGTLVALRAIAFALVHDLRGRGKARLGLSCGLWGNGMVITRPLMEQITWDAFSAVEDAEQHIRLLLAGARVTYVPDAQVYGHMPSTFGAAEGQQIRWEGGRISLVKRYHRSLAAAAVRQRRVSPLLALLDLALPPLSVLVLTSTVLCALAFLFGMTDLSLLALSTLLSLAAYVALGAALAGLPPRTYLALLHAPRFIAWKLLLYARELTRRREPDWVRTARD